MEELFEGILKEEELREYVEESYINIYLDLYQIYCKVICNHLSNSHVESILNRLENAENLSMFYFLQLPERMFLDQEEQEEELDLEELDELQEEKLIQNETTDVSNEKILKV